MVKLQGIKTLPFDKNFPDYEKYSNKAFQYSKSNLAQRDVMLQLFAVDRRGNFISNVILQNVNFSLDLLRLGYAFVFKAGRISSNLLGELQKQQQEAKKQKVGMWSSRIRVDSGDSNVYKTLKQQAKSAVISDIYDATEFYYQDPTSAELVHIENQLQQFDDEAARKLHEPIKDGCPCVANFSQDKKWYRCRVISKSKKKKDMYTVQFVDYGNRDLVTYQKMRQIPKKLFSFEDQAKKATLAYIRSCGLDDDHCGEKSASYFSEKTWEQKLQAKAVSMDGNYTYVMLYPRGQLKVENSLNYKMIRKGFAKFDDENFQIPNHLKQAFQQAQEYASNKALGIWKYGGEFQDQSGY